MSALSWDSKWVVATTSTLGPIEQRAMCKCLPMEDGRAYDENWGAISIRMIRMLPYSSAVFLSTSDDGDTDLSSDIVPRSCIGEMQKSPVVHMGCSCNTSKKRGVTS